MKFLFKILVSSIAVVLAAYILKGVTVDKFTTAILIAIVLSFLNSFIKPILVVLTIPVTLFTFGLFLLVINALMIIITSKFIDGFKVDGFWWALLFSIILSVITSALESFTKTRNIEQNN